MFKKDHLRHKTRTSMKDINSSTVNIKGKNRDEKPIHVLEARWSISDFI